MASKFNFQPGADWVKKVNDFMNEYYGLDQGASNQGVTYYNGVVGPSGSGSPNVRWQTLSNKSGIAFVLLGSLRIPFGNLGTAGNIGSGTNLFKLPASVSAAGADSVDFMAPCTSGQVRLHWSNDTSIMSIAYIYGTTLAAAKESKPTDTLWLDCTHIFPNLKFS